MSNQRLRIMMRTATDAVTERSYTPSRPIANTRKSIIQFTDRMYFVCIVKCFSADNFREFTKMYIYL